MNMAYYFRHKNDYCGVYTVNYYALLYGTSNLRAITPFKNTFSYILKINKKIVQPFRKKRTF